MRAVPQSLDLRIDRITGKENRDAALEIVSEAVGYMVQGVALSMDMAADSMQADLPDRIYSREEVADILRNMAEITRKGWLDA